MMICVLAYTAYLIDPLTSLLSIFLAWQALLPRVPNWSRVNKIYKQYFIHWNEFYKTIWLQDAVCSVVILTRLVPPAVLSLYTSTYASRAVFHLLVKSMNHRYRIWINCQSEDGYSFMEPSPFCCCFTPLFEFPLW